MQNITQSLAGRAAVLTLLPLSLMELGTKIQENTDLLIFNVIKISFNDELQRLKKTKIMREIKEIIKKDLGKRLQHYLLYVFAGILIATPLPDEAGISMLAGLTHIKQKILAPISFILHTLGILIILLLSS